MLLNKILDKSKNNFKFFHDNLNDKDIIELVDLLIKNKENNIKVIPKAKNNNIFMFTEAAIPIVIAAK